MHSYKILLDRTKNTEENPCHRLIPVSFNAEGVHMEIITCSMLDGGTGYSMIRIIDSDGSHVKEGTYEYDDGDCVINKFSTKHYVAMVLNKRCRLSKLINESGCFLTYAAPLTEDLIEWTVIGPNSGSLHNLVESMKDNGYSVKIQASENLDMTLALTEKQEHYFNTAFSMGYYDIPKRVDLEELCRVLSCSKSTLNIVLRTAEKKIFDTYKTAGNMMHLRR